MKWNLMRRRRKWQQFNSKFGIVESLRRKLLDCRRRNCSRYLRTSVCFKRQMDTFCLFKSIIQEILVKVLSLADTFTFSANIICYNDPNFLCWHNLLTEIFRFELASKTPPFEALISDGRELTSPLLLLWHYNELWF